MLKLRGALGTKRYFFLILVFLLSTDLAILLNIPILRQFLGFFFFTIIPGLLILHILKLNRLGLVERIVLSVGLSLSFLIFFGLLMNQLYPLLGYITPLSTTSLIISFSIILLILTIIAYLRSRTVLLPNLADFRLDTTEKAFLLLPSIFPFLSILGMHLMNTTDNNVMLVALLFLILSYVILIAVLHRQVPERIWPATTFFIGIALLLVLALRSSHIIGSDAHDEYYLFQLASDSGQWQIFLGSTLDASLSISLLPTIYQSFLNIDPEYLFKILYSLLFSISPLVVYLIFKKYLSSLNAFLASIFFMAQLTFLWVAFNSRTTLAILFCALAIMVLFRDSISEVNKRLLFIVFAASIIVSHYSTAYVFFFILLLTWIGMQIMHRIMPRQKKLAGGDPPSSARQPSLKSQTSAGKISYPRLKSNIGITTVALFFVMMFLWYSQLTKVAFTAGVLYISETLAKLNQFFLLESRGGEAATAFGRGLGAKGIPQHIEFVYSWLTIAFIAIGVLITVARYKKMVSTPDSGHIKPNFLQSKIDTEYFVLSLACCAILVSSVALPHALYSMDRLYFQMMVVLSPFFVIGGITVAQLFRVHRFYSIVLVVLIPYFMCTTGLMYQVFGFPQAITLNSEGPRYERLYVHDQESYAAKWLEEYTEEGTTIYTCHPLGQAILRSQGKILLSRTRGSLISRYQKGEEINGYIYLRYTSITVDRVVTEYPDILAGNSKIYDSGNSEVYEAYPR